MKEIEKLAKHFKRFIFCGQLSDPVHHPKFIEIITYLKNKNIEVDIHNASSTKSQSGTSKHSKQIQMHNGLLVLMVYHIKVINTE